MNILLVPDKFKGSLTANEACEALREGLLEAHPDFTIDAVPMADGGEGTCELLTNYFHGRSVELEVTGPLFKKIKADYGISKNGSTAFIEMAKASGLQLLKPKDRNPLFTTSLGTGELIKDALDRGVKKILLGIGGSATNDAGIGMATSLGFEFFDTNKEKLNPIGANLIQLHSIKKDKIHPRISQVEFVALCDVDNPLFGPQGAAYIYAPQKGANEESIKILDNGLRNFEKVIIQEFNKSSNFPGAGAAGGLAGGANIFLNATIHKGISYIIDATGLEAKISMADVIITGEGKIDDQTLSGKVVMAIGGLGRKLSKTIIAMAGKCELSIEQLNKIGIAQVITLMDQQVSEKEALSRAYSLLKEKAKNLV